jgi:uncharacterized protein YkwD
MLQANVFIKLFVVLSCCFFNLRGNTQNVSAFSDEVVQKANSAEKNTQLNEGEKKIIFYMNLVRLEPQQFLNSILIPYIKENEVSKNSYYNSLVRDLKNAQSTSILVFTDDLHSVAAEFAKDLSKSGKVGHVNSKGQDFGIRSKALMASYSTLAENCQFGYDSALDIVIDLLIDDGIPSLGHRKTILNKEYQFVGVSTNTHKDYAHCSVQVFGGR